jgi:hypothetical protein
LGNECYKAGTETPIETNFELNDTLYAKASITPEDTDEVYLWLGANVMLAYPLDEAVTMLDEKLSAAESSLRNCEEDLEFLREQITVRILLYIYIYSYQFFEANLSRTLLDAGSRNRPRLQLGRCAEAKRKSGRETR